MENKSHNYGIALLKIFLSFVVVCCHFWTRESSNLFALFFEQMRGLAVPCFVLITFYYFAKLAKSRSVERFKSRMIRLLIPYFGWAIIYFIAFYPIPLYKIFSPDGGTLMFQDLGWQLLFGSSGHLDLVLWYLWDIIVISAVIFLVYYFIPERIANYVMLGLSFLAIVMQYTQWNYNIFGSFPFEARYTLGRISEIFPYSVIGITLSDINIEKQRKSSTKWMVIAALCVLFVIVGVLPIFQSIENAFGYQGIKHIILSTSIVIIAMIIPLGPSNAGQRLKDAIITIEKCGLGIFCTHLAVGSASIIIMSKLGISISPTIHCILIWLVCLVACFIISKIPNKYVRSLVN